jgi:hypothetical protein
MYGLSFYDLTTFFFMHNLYRWSLPDYVCCLFFKIWCLSNVQLPSFQPHNTRWLNTVERRLAQARLSEDVGEADKDNAEESYVSVVKSNLTSLNISCSVKFKDS